MDAHPSRALPLLSESEAWAMLGEPVEHVAPIGMGTRSRVYKVTLADGSVRVVKLLPRDQQRAAREQWVRTRMAGVAAVPTVPEVAVRQGSLVEHCDAVVMRFLPGSTAAKVLPTMETAQAARVWHQMGEGLAAFHAVPVEGFGLLDGAGRGAFATWREAVEAFVATSLTTAHDTDLHDLCDEAHAFVTARLPSLDAVRAARLIHGDATPGNVQVVGDRVTAWFDFEYAMGADPLYELTFVAEGFDPAMGRHCARCQEAFAEGYTARSEAHEDAPDRTDLYRVLHALRATEMLRVLGPTMTDEARAATTQALRTRLQARLQR